jgi:hypothetical protein
LRLLEVQAEKLLSDEVLPVPADEDILQRQVFVSHVHPGLWPGD